MLNNIVPPLVVALWLAAAGTSPVAQDPPEPRVIPVTAKRFVFEPARIDVTEGETVRLVVTSADGVHGIAIKKLRIEELVPRGGTPVTIEFTANAVGKFPILCSEFCGKGHDGMKGLLVVAARPTGR